MKRHLISILILTTAISCTNRNERIKPEVTPLTESVYASATIQPVDLYDVYAAVPGTIERLYVSEGDTVISDQVLARITADVPSINLESARLSAELAKERYLGSSNVFKSLEEEIRSTRNQLKLDSVNYQRQKRLWSKRIGSAADLENRKLQYDLTRNKLDILENDYAQQKLELENQYRQSRNALRKAESDLGEYTISSRMDGTVYALLKEEGERVSQQEVVARVGKSNAFILEMQIDEVDVVRVREGQSILVTLDAYGDRVFSAVLVKIYPQKDQRNQTYKIEGALNDPPAVLYAGMSGEANIIISESGSVMTIPLEYLVGDRTVLTEDGERTVETGRRNIERVEILSGIDTTTTLMKP